MPAPWTLLVVDASAEAVQALAAPFVGEGAKVLTAGSVTEAVTLLVDTRVDLAVVNVALPGESGLSVLEHLRVGEGATPVFLVGVDDPAARAQAFRLGCDDALANPVDPVELLARAHYRLAAQQTLADARAEAARLHELAVTDGLTQVANHRAFQDRLREEFRRAQRYDDPLALIIADADHFKAINDMHGHQVGDEVLKLLASAVRNAVRETDFVARYGGEEFAVILPKTHLAGALTVAQRIAADLHHLKLHPAGLKLTASFGVSGFPGRSVNTVEQLIKTADDALLRAKREGRNKISLFQATQLTASPPGHS